MSPDQVVAAYRCWPAKAVAGQDEDPLIGGARALPLVDRLAVDQREGVVHPRAAAQKGGIHVRAVGCDLRGDAAEGPAACGVRVALDDLRLAGVEPPGVDPQAEEPLVDLGPIERPGGGIESVVVGERITDEIEIATCHVGGEDEAARGECLVVVGVRIELRPHRDHEVRVVRLVDRVEQALRIRIATGIELVRAPAVRDPVLPILDDVVDGRFAASVAGEDAGDVGGRSVVLARLPVPEGPAGQHRRLAGEPPITGDHLVHVGAVDKVVVRAVADLRPERRRPGRRRRRLPAELQEVHPDVARPLQVQGDLLAGLQGDLGDLDVGQPPLPPVVDHGLVVDVELQVARRVGEEFVISGRGRGDRSLPVDGAGAGARDGVVGVVGDIGDAWDLHRQAQIAEARVRGVVPEDPVAAARDEVRDEDLGVLLVKIEIVSLDVEVALLVLAEPVERFVGLGLPLLTNVVGRLPLHGRGGQRPATARLLGEDGLAGRVEKRDRAAGRVHAHRQRGGRDQSSDPRRSTAASGWRHTAWARSPGSRA